MPRPPKDAMVQQMHRMRVYSVHTGQLITGFPRVYSNNTGPAQVKSTYGARPDLYRVVHDEGQIMWLEHPEGA